MRSPARCGFYNEVGAVDEERLAALIPKGEVGDNQWPYSLTLALALVILALFSSVAVSLFVKGLSLIHI